MSESMQSSRPMLAWMEVLDRIERSLEQSLANAPELPEAPTQAKGAGAAAMQMLDARLARWQTCLDQASQNAEQADAQVAAEEAALAELIPRLKTARERLASQIKRPA
jgi:DNA repair exonuclease SbcCD ATPase subunit